MPKSREQFEPEFKPEKELGQKKRPEERAAEFLEDIASKIESGKISEKILNAAMDELNRHKNDIEHTLQIDQIASQHLDKKLPDELVERSKKAKSTLAEIESKLKEALES